MGCNLALNMESRGFQVSVYSINSEETERLEKGIGKDKNFSFQYDLKSFVDSLEKPRRVFLMIRAGAPVDGMIEKLLPLLEDGDILIDGGNSNYQDSIRRTKLIEENGKLFIGTGVSGGEEGALHGPSMMPGGSRAAWEAVRPIFQAISAKTEDGSVCCDWVGDNGAGHFVKMVHNGIEYGDMQLIAETYHIMKDLLGLSYEEMQEVFRYWNTTELDSYLIEITGNILGYKDEDGEPLVTKIRDAAGQKGTGKWTAISSLEEGVPLTLIGEAVFARCLSSMKEERVAASAVFPKEKPVFTGDRDSFLEDLRQALYASKIISYAQGYALMKQAAETYGWDLNYGGIALLWRGGCIIRSAFLGKIKEAYDRDPGLSNLLLDPYFTEAVKKALPGWRRVLTAAISNGIPAPAMTAALSYFDGYTSPILPADLLQAQRDYFGAHTYERLDDPSGKHYHTDWTGEGTGASSTSYNV